LSNKVVKRIVFFSLLSLSTGVMGASLPENYQSLNACEKQGELWSMAVASEYKKLPDFSNLGLFQFLAMHFQKLKQKVDYDSDVSPKKWKKYLHRHGALAKVKIVPVGKEKYTGVFKGAECALLRLSLTYNPKGEKPVAPGLALKVLRDGLPSANVSALYGIDGQGKEFNFFKYPLSNIVPAGETRGAKLMHKLFKKVTHYPEELMLEHMAATDAHGVQEESSVIPAQIFFVPGPNMMGASTDHDVREDFLAVPEGAVVYKIYALKATPVGFNDYSEYTQEDATRFLGESELIAHVVTTSKFIASEFGDDGIFFRHQVRP
jgi:hypothetical protein